MTAPEDPLKPEIRRGAGWRRLLAALDPDSQAAFSKLARLRTKLIRYFEANQCVFADDLADEVIDRVFQHLEADQSIANIESYALGTARLLRQEEVRRQVRARDALAEMARIHSPQSPGDTRETQCFERCLDALDPEKRRLILTYYHGDARERIQTRQKQAAELGLDSASLRNRALRLRRSLEKCVRNCLQSVTDPSTSTHTIEGEEDQS